MVKHSTKKKHFHARKRASVNYIPVAEPTLSGNELRYVTDAVRSGWVSSAGPFVTKFENAFADFSGTKFAVSCSSGTAALHLVLSALGIGPGDEVIVPSLTFIATANAVRYVGAKPVFVDVEREFWQMDPARMEKAISKKTKANIPVHLYGQPADMRVILGIARKYDIFLIEDAAEAIGAEIDGKRVGSWGIAGVFSFYGNKIITTGEGGMVTTNSRSLARRLSVLRNHGMSRTQKYLHERLGFNYRLTNLQAAVGLAQLEKIDDLLRKKIAIARWYDKYLDQTAGIRLPKTAPWAKNVYWMYSIVVDPAVSGITRDGIIQKLQNRGIETRPFFRPVHTQPIYSAYKKTKLPNTEFLSLRGLNLPSSANLDEEQVRRISKIIKSVL